MGKMENVRIDDRRIHIDFSQSVPKAFSNWMRGGSGLRVGRFGWKPGSGQKVVPFGWKGGADGAAGQSQQALADQEGSVSGVVTKWIEDRGFGFVRRDSETAGGEGIFVHRSTLING